MEADILISCLVYIFWRQTQMFSMYSKTKGSKPIGLAVPIVLEGTVYLRGSMRNYQLLFDRICFTVHGG